MFEANVLMIVCFCVGENLEDIDCDSEGKLQQNFLYITVSCWSFVIINNCNVNVM